LSSPLGADLRPERDIVLQAPDDVSLREPQAPRPARPPVLCPHDHLFSLCLICGSEWDEATKAVVRY
jgi:hypothetical protein